MISEYKALVVSEKEDGSFKQRVKTVPFDFLPENEVLIKVQFAGLNYKDALSANGNKGVTKRYPHTPGVDAAGIVVSDSTEKFSAGDKVICTSHDLGMNTPGGCAEYISVPAEWVVPLPDGISMKDSMVMGTAAYTAGLALYKMEAAGQTPDMGEIVVTGATGGVGSMAVAILAKAGYGVVASTGKKDKIFYLLEIGAKKCIGREEVDDKSGKPLLKSQWAGAIDNVGGNTLATLLKSCGRNGNVASIGLVDSPELTTTVFPFILNGINLLGIDSAETPHHIRLKIWEKLASVWKLDKIKDMQTLISLEDAPHYLNKILKGKAIGRVVVDLNK
ncbi:MAG: YhdH/YhfP family quinone oxidoreductase [Flavobacteriales bacterium]